MTTTKSASEGFNMDDFDALLAALSAEDLETVNDLIDPEVSSTGDFSAFAPVRSSFRILFCRQVNDANLKQ